MRISGFSSLFSAIAVLLYYPTNVLKLLRSLGKSMNSQESSLISKEKVNKVMYVMFLRGGVVLPQQGLGRTFKAACSPRGHSGHLLETPFSEPLLRTFLTVKPIAGPLLRTLLRALPQNPSQNLLRTLLRTLCCRTAP